MRYVLVLLLSILVFAFLVLIMRAQAPPSLPQIAPTSVPLTGSARQQSMQPMQVEHSRNMQKNLPIASSQVLSLPRTTYRRTFSPTPFLVDDFSNAAQSMVQAGEHAHTRYVFAEGIYAIHAHQADMFVWSLVAGEYTRLRDLAVQVDAHATGEESVCGIVFRYQDDAHFYLFQVANNGLYSLELVQDGSWETLIGWTPSQAITTPADAPDGRAINTLRVEMAGEYITLVVNDVPLETTVDSRLSYGKIALAVNSFAERKVLATFDNLALFKLENSTHAQ
jgi:hypothetical protein